MHTMQTPMVSKIKGVELWYTPKLSDQIQWERAADSRRPSGDLQFVLADRTAPPPKPPQTRKKKSRENEKSWDGIRCAILTFKQSKVTITDLGYESKLGHRISVNSKVLDSGRPQTIQDGDTIEFPARARTSAEIVDNVETRNITVRVKFLLEVVKDGPIIWRFMPEPLTGPTEPASLTTSAHSAPIKSKGRTREGRAALKILTSPPPTNVVTSAVPPSVTTLTRTEPSTPQARPPLRPGFNRNSGTRSEHTGSAVQSSPSSLRKRPIDNTAEPETPTDWTSSSSLFSRSSFVLSSPSSPTTPDESPEQSRSPSPESSKPTVGPAMRSKVTSPETFHRPAGETPSMNRPIRSRSPSPEAGSPSTTLTLTRPPTASASNQRPTFAFDGEPVRQVKLSVGASHRVGKNDKPSWTGIEFVREGGDEGANIVGMKAEKIPSSDHDFNIVGPFYTETKRGTIGEYRYARLTLRPSKVTLARIGSMASIRLQSKSHSFEFRETGQTHPLQDGDIITFWTSQADRTPICFKVNLLTRPASNDCPIRFVSKLTEASVLPHDSPPVFTRRDGPLSRHSAETSDVVVPGEPKSKVDLDTGETHTELDQQTEIPWADSLRVGHGFDALAGVSKAGTVFQGFEIERSSQSKHMQIHVEHLTWQTVEEWRNKVEIGVGASVNLPSPQVGANAKIAQILAKHATTSTILVQCTIDATFPPEYILEDTIRLQPGPHTLSATDFRAKYGDYYVSGYQRGYSCRLIAICQTHEEKATHGLELKAEAYVRNYVNAKGAVDKSQTAANNFSVHNVILLTEGCTVDPRILSGDLSDINKTLSYLNVSENLGLRRVAYLYHYSALSYNLSPRVDVPLHMFTRARRLRDMYTHLQNRLLHPAVPESTVIIRALENFRSLRRLLVQMGGHKKPSIDRLQQDLESAKDVADTFIRRYKFICTLMKMNGIAGDLPAPTGNGWILYGWKSGTLGGGPQTGSNPSKSVFSDTAQEIFELEWSSPPIEGTYLRSQKDMTLSTHLGPGPALPPARNIGGLQRLFKRTKKETGQGTFTLSLRNHEPIYIVGWHISGHCPDGVDAPKIPVAHKSHTILSDKLKITVDTTRETHKWVCRVAFVKQSSYNFPNLGLSARS
ncbi:hypothetical protein B0H16DRAFT_1568184 [Mycena metata]|uniref:Uncharacterized protein n=1 Tax=Mycena metata TaxID=1033252 RepID=A0AAD7IEA3_9AGAR|nr:hypothetical protein B0H16DRAFT_1568184 [Mycena metata]